MASDERSSDWSEGDRTLLHIIDRMRGGQLWTMHGFYSEQM